jgi:WD40 repeat protein
MLCESDPSKTRDYSCISVDLEHGGKTVERFLGHGGEIYALSASTGDPHAFVTGASDGYARLFDTRRTNLPVLTVSAGAASSDICSAALLVDPDGVPSKYLNAY